MRPPITDVDPEIDRRARPPADAHLDHHVARRRSRWPGARAVVHLALVLLAVAAFLALLERQAPSPGVEIEVRDPPAGIDEIRVYISGAVREPGVVTLAPGERVADAVERAGGATEGADLLAVNLARRVADEDHVHVPRTGEASPLVDINAATAAELELLPGIGPVRAAQIVDARATRRFATTDELVDRSILPSTVYEQLRDLVTTTAEVAAP